MYEKQIALSLLILNLNNAHAMEHGSIAFLNSFPFTLFLPTWLSSFTHAEKRKASFPSFSLLQSYVPTRFSVRQIPNESKAMLALRTSKNKFENELSLDKWVELTQRYVHTTFFICDLEKYPKLFLEYCYYLKFHNIHCLRGSFPADLDWLDYQDEQRFKQYQEEQLDGYSALGAAMLAKEASIKQKRIFIIQELINRGFKPTPKDIELAELILYDAIAEYQNTIIDLSHNQPQANWSVFPQEIRKQIVQYMVQLFKNEHWLLPEALLLNNA